MNIFPCRDKKPLVSDWGNNAKPFEEWVKEDTRWQDHDEWGAPTGPQNGFWVLDFDVKSGGMETLKGLTLPDTVTLQTRNGGVHKYFQWGPDLVIRNTAGFLPGVDVRGDGGYVVLYGDPTEAPIAPTPKWLIDALQKPQRAASQADVHGEVGEGGRNHYLTAAAGRLQRLGVLSLASLKELNESKCVPPLDDSEVEMIYASVSRYAPDSSPSEDAPAIVWAKDLAKAMVDYLSDKDLVKGEPTGLEELDRLLGGGKRLGEVTVTLAEAKTGKNTLWHFLQLPWLQKGTPIGYASRELSPEIEVLPNLLTLALGKNLYAEEDIDEGDVAEALAKWKLAFAPGYGPLPKEELFAWMDACRAAGVQHFFIDHLHYCLLDPEDFKGISVFIRDLKAYARKNLIHIDLIVQPKLQEQGQRLSLNSLRGGASIGQALDNLITMQRVRDDEGKLTNVVKVTLEVARSKLAEPGSFFLAYDKKTMTFAVVEPVADEAEEVPPSYAEQKAAAPRPASPITPRADGVEQAAKRMADRIKRLG